MPPIPVISEAKADELASLEINPKLSCDNLSVTSVTKRITKIFDDYPIEYCSSADTFDASNLHPSDTLLAVNVSEAVSKGDLASLSKILDDLNTSPLDFTSPYGNLLHISASLSTLEDFIRILIWSKLSPNSVNSNDGSTALHLAVRLNRQDIVEYLLSLTDIDDTIRDIEGLTCVDYCRKNRQLYKLFEDSRSFFRFKIVKQLFKSIHKQKREDLQSILSKNRVQNLVDFNTKNSYGDSLLHMAAKTENEEIVKICLRIGVDPFMKNKKGKIAMELAKKPSLRDLLKQAPMIRSKEIPNSLNGSIKVEGYLYKYTNFANGFRPRWFVLENSILSYYNNPSEHPISCRGSINLEYVDIVPNEGNACKFDLITSSHPKSPGQKTSSIKIHLKADAQDEAKRWIIALKQAKEAVLYNNYEKPALSPIHLLNLTCSSSSIPHLPPTNDLELAFLIISRHGLQMAELPESELKRVLIDNVYNLKSILERIDQLLGQKNRRLEAQRKEKDLLEDAVRSLALENNKWQSWARGQLSRIDPASFSPGRNSPNPENTKDDVITSLENHLESTMKTSTSDDGGEYDEDLYFDAYEEEDSDDDKDSEDDSEHDSGKNSEDDSGNGSGKGSDECSQIHNAIEKGSTVSLSTTPTDSYGYPLVPRSKIPVDSTKMPAISLWSILKSAIRQQDLTRMPIPINFSEPLSMLQRMCEDLEYFELLETASSLENDPARRLLYIAAFAISSYSGTDKRISKPFNPLLGETFELITPQFKYLSEQVSHHPPIGASYCTAPGFTYWNEVHVTSRFKAKYLELKPEGMSHIRMGGCHYSWNRVNTAVNNIIVGKIYLEHYGKMIIKSHGPDGLIAEIDFLSNGWRRGTSNRIDGKIVDPKDKKVAYKITGTWNESIEAKSGDSEAFSIWKRAPIPPDSDIQYNFSSFAMRLNELPEQLKSFLCPTDSRLRPDQRAMEEGDFDSASRLKLKLEEKQRRARKHQESDDSFFDYKPKWFKKAVEEDTEEEHWEYVGGYWESRGEAKGWPEASKIYL